MEAEIVQEGQAILVEDSEIARAFAHLLDASAGDERILSLDALTGYNTPTPLEAARRLRTFTHWLPDSEKPKAHAYLKTVEDLRGAFVTSHEDIEFAFSELPETPKNVFLRQAAHEYLESPLKADRAESLWRFIESLKAGELMPTLPERVSILKTHEASYGFNELLKLLPGAPGVAKVEVITPLEFTKQEGPRRALNVIASAPTALSVLSHSIARAIRRGQKASVSFFGTPVQGQYLKHKLGSLGIACDFLFPKETTLPLYSADDVTLQMIRQDKGRPLKERLELSQALLRSNKTAGTAIALESLPTPKEKIQVPLLPYFPYPSTLNDSLYYFVDKTASGANTKHPLLDRHELNLLKSAGFAIPTQEDRLLAEVDYTRVIASSHDKRARLFSTSDLGAGSLRSKTKRLKTKTPPPAPLGSYKVPFEARHFSASQLEAYARCPAQYLLANRLKLDEGTGDFESEFALLFGSAIHQALEIYKKDGLRGEEALHECLAKALATDNFAPLSGSEKFLIKETARPFFKKFLENEAVLIEKFKTEKTLALEQSFEITLEGVRLKGKIDRVDEVEGGKLLVMDYKTGNVTFSPNHVAAGTNFQALVYLLGAESQFKAPIAGVLFSDLKKGELRRGLLRAESTRPEAAKNMTRGHVLPEEKLTALIETGTEKLKEQVTAISSGDFSPKPDPQHCATCRLFGHCRMGAGYV